MSVNEIGNLCFTLKLNGRYEQDVTAFSQKRGEAAALEVLRKIKQQRDHDKAQGNHYGKTAVTLWKQYSQEYVRGLAAKKRKEAENEERSNQEASYRAAKKKGYIPTKEVIKAQLDELYQDSKISITEYEHGIVGLQFVHGMVGQAMNLPENDEERREITEAVPVSEVFSNEAMGG